jgi:putative Mn2+ efflux pump MntP
LISIQTEILVTQSIVYFLAAVIPIYLTFIGKKKIGNDNNHFKRLTIVLAGFVLMQGFYHVIGSFGYNLLAKGILEPLSFGILVFFGVFYIISKTSAQNEDEVRVK